MGPGVPPADTPKVLVTHYSMLQPFPRKKCHNITNLPDMLAYRGGLILMFYPRMVLGAEM